MSEELNKIKNEKIKLKICGKEREIKFNFSAWSKLEEKYGNLSNLSNLEKDISEKPFTIIPELIWIALVDKDGVDKEHVLDDYGLQDVEHITQVLYSAIYGSLPKTDEKKNIRKVK